MLAESSATHFALVYLQEVRGRRGDVVNLYLPLMEYPWYVDQVRQRHPALQVPPWSPGVVSELVSLNKGERAVFTDWIPEGSLFAAASLVPHGLLFRVLTDDALEESPRSQSLRGKAEPTARARVDRPTLEFFMERRLVLAEYHDRRGRGDAAATQCQAALRLAEAHKSATPSPLLSATAHTFLASRARARNDLTAEIAHLERAVSLRPEDPSLRDALAAVYARAGRMEDGVEQWMKARDLKP